MNILKKWLMRLRGQIPTEDLIKKEMKVGTHFSRRNSTSFDSSHAYMITIGNYVTFAGGGTVLAHDASTKMYLNYTRIGKVTIGDYVFIGENVLILPGVTIGDNVIIGAGSVVTHNIPSNSVAVGNPCHVIGNTNEYIDRKKKELESSPIFEKEYLGQLSQAKIDELRMIEKNGYII